MRKESKKMEKRIALVLTIALVFSVGNFFTVFAYDGYLAPFEGFVNSFYGLISLIGKALLGWAFFEVATALFSHDTSQMPQGLRRISGGCILVFIEPLVNAMTTVSSTTPPAT